MKEVLKFITVLLLFVTVRIQAQTPLTITKPDNNADYIVTGTETLIATQSITLKPNTWIKAGSTFIAKIVPDAYIPVNFSNENYIYTRTFQKPMTTNSSIVNNGDLIENITYFDGLGRPMQNIAIKASPSKQDLVVPVVYDNLGRQEREYLPYMDTVGAIASYRGTADAITRVNTYYSSNYSTDINIGQPNPFSQKKFEDSPLSRPLEHAAPGYDWRLGSGNEIKLDYQTNTVLDKVRNFEIYFSEGNTMMPRIEDKGLYAAFQLEKIIVKDENWKSNQTFADDHSTHEFKNKEGQTILKRNFDGGKFIDTYYIYDIFGNLTYVIPPLVDKDKTINYQINSGYKNYTKSFNQSVFSGTTSGSGTVDVTITNNVLKVVFSAGFNASMLNTTPQDLLTGPCSLPDMHLGTISNGNYSVSIVDGKLKLTNITGLSSTGFSATFTVNLPNSCESSHLTTSIDNGYENFSKSFSHSVFTGSTSGGGGVNVTITNNILKIVFGAGFAASMLNTTPQDLPTYPCTLPDMTLGNISENNYSASIVDGKLKLTNLTGATSTGFASTFIINLPSSCATTYTPEDQTILDNLDYQYRYDHRNRLVEKKLPGKDWEYIIYDKLNRPVLIQDANLRKDKKWIFTKYDAFSRPAYTGEYVNLTEIARQDIQLLADASVTLFETKQAESTINSTTIYYSNNAFPNSEINLFTINYYDDYLNLDLDGGTAVDSYSITPITNAKGLPTATKTRVLGTNNWITNITYYDSKGRSIYNYNKNNFLDVVNTIKNQLDFGGKVLGTTTTHKKSTSAEIKIVDSFSYDHTGRLLTQKQSVNDKIQEVISINNYNDLGQLISKGIGGKISQNRLQNIDYTYNIHGWMKEINDVNAIGNDLFSFKLSYNDPSAPIKLYNGNISQSFWKTANIDTSLKNYNYTFDALNRLTQATDNQNRYTEILSYDLNGNIKTLKRNGNQVLGTSNYGPIDDLTYEYLSGNKLNKVTDATGNTEGFKDVTSLIDYEYDANGNMITDSNKGITSITYNHLNLPTVIQIAGKSITYAYDANGIKLRKTVNGETTDYAGGFQYLSETLKFFPHPEGYVEWNNGDINYIYQYKDHLGNIRLSFKDGDKDGTVTNNDILSEDNYYSFGLKHKGYNEAIVNSTNKYKYNGKELQDELGLNMYDYGARNYDPALGRWMNIDPLAEVSRRWSPYVYCYDNPVRFVDPDGMLASDPGDLYNLKGEHVGNDGVKDNAVYLVHTNSSQQLTQTESKHLVAGTLAPGLSSGPKVEQKEISNDELNLRASLSTLKQTEAGSANAPLDYNSWNMGDNFTEKSFTEKPSDYSKHPGMNTEGGGGSAAGAYQALERFYKGSDFSPKSQDASAVNNMTSSSFAAAKSGSGADFKTTTEGRWTSLKHFTAGGVQQLINNYRAQELKGSSTIATPVGELLKTRR